MTAHATVPQFGRSTISCRLLEYCHAESNALNRVSLTILQRLLKLALLATLGLSGCGGSPSTSPPPPPGGKVSVDARSARLATVSKDVFGVNLSASMDLTNTYSTYNAMMTAFQKTDFGMVRWPMAGISDYYHWQTNSFSSCSSIWNPIARTTFDQFMQQVTQPLGVDVNITVNYGSNSTCTGGGDPNEAAAWVDYANNQMHYGIKYWSIGNEQYYGSPTLGSTPTTPDFNVLPTDPGSVGSATYANLIASQFYPLMKAKDPSIQIGVDLVVPDNNASTRTMPWDSTVLANASFDFVEVHWYGSNPANVAISDSALLTSGISYFTSAVTQLRSELSAAGKANVPIYVGEWGIPGEDGGSPQSVTIVGALYTAMAYGELINAGIPMAGLWEGFESDCTPASPGDYSKQDWFTSSLFQAFSVGSVPGCAAALPPPGTPLPRANARAVVQQAFNVGDDVIAPTLTSPSTIRAYAGRRASGYGLLLVNLDESAGFSASVQIVDDSRSFVLSSLVYGKAQYDQSQYNIWSQPMSQSLGVVSGSFAIDLPPWSVTAISLSAQ